MSERATWAAGESFDRLPVRTRIAWRPGYNVQSQEGSLRLVGALGGVDVHRLNDRAREALLGLSAEGVRLQDVLVGLTMHEQRQFAAVLRSAAWALSINVDYRDRPLLAIEHTARAGLYRFAEVDPMSPVRLGRFSMLRSRDDCMVLESACTPYRAVLVDADAQRLVGLLGVGRAPADLVTPELPHDAVGEVIGHLVGTGLVVPIAQQGAEEVRRGLREWQFHDLLFHTRSRHGAYDGEVGGYFPFRGETEPSPAVKQPPRGPAIALPAPSWSTIVNRDPPLVAVMEARRSIRRHGNRPLSKSQLGEFLYRVARVRSRTAEGADFPYPITSRPYPSGGATYNLELYLTIGRCGGLDPGIYYYSPGDHSLILVNDGERERREHLAVAARSAGVPEPPQILITVTSRFRRLSWKYLGLAYNAGLKNVGVLYDAMYLVTTAMGIAGCGLGSGGSQEVAEWLGLAYFEESPVGEFMIGTRGEEPVGRTEPDWAGCNSPDWAENARAAVEIAARDV